MALDLVFQRSSARETIGRVAAGAVAKKLLKTYSDVDIVGYVQKVQDIAADNIDVDKVTLEDVERYVLRWEAHAFPAGS